MSVRSNIYYILVFVLVIIGVLTMTSDGGDGYIDANPYNLRIPTSYPATQYNNDLLEPDMVKLRIPNSNFIAYEEGTTNMY